MKASIVISSYNRAWLLKRTLYSIARYGPTIPYEVILVDDNSTEDILPLLKPYNSVFNWKFIQFDSEEFETKTGIKKFFNSPSVTNNIGFQYAKNELVFQQGNEIIATKNIYDNLINASRGLGDYFIGFSTTYDVPLNKLRQLDELGTNADEAFAKSCSQWVLQSPDFMANVTNYIFITTKKLWEKLGGYNENFMKGIAAEDSDFVRRARKFGAKEFWTSDVSLHQCHKGKTLFYDADPSIITKEKWREGVALNKVVYDKWDENYLNNQDWPIGTIGIKSVITNKD